MAQFWSITFVFRLVCLVYISLIHSSLCLQGMKRKHSGLFVQLATLTLVNTRKKSDRSGETSSLFTQSVTELMDRKDVLTKLFTLSISPNFGTNY